MFDWKSGFLLSLLLYVPALSFAQAPLARPLTNKTFERTPQRLERGKYLVNGILQCFICHSDRDWKKHGAPPISGKVGAGSMLWDEKDSRMVAPNITPDKTTGAGTWSDDMLARAIREGIGHDGRALHPQMWYTSFRMLSDEDIASVVVYLRSIPPVRNSLPKRRLTKEREEQIKQNPKPLLEPMQGPAPSSVLERGKYFVRIADCAGCHTYWYGKVNPGFFAGGNPIEFGGVKAFSTNITNDPSGISYYDDALFIEVMRTGKLKGARTLSSLMPWIAFRNMNDPDLKSIFAFLRSLKPMRHEIANGEPPAFCKLCEQTHGYGKANLPWKPKPAHINPHLYNSYIGKYRYPDGFTVSIAKEGNKLFLVTDDGNKTELIPQSETTFVSEGLASPITFVKDKNGKVVSLTENSAFDPAIKIGVD